MSGLAFEKAEFVRAFGISSQLTADARPQLVFSGRSNVGKSSLINRLCNRKRLARVSATPGKTSTVNFYSAGEVYLVDLPGYGYAKTSAAERRRWDELINGYFSGIPNIILLLQLLDCRHPPSADDEAMLKYLRHYGVPFAAVLTKADKCKPSAHAGIVAEFEERLGAYPNLRGVVLTSAEKGTGMDALRGLLHTACAEPAGEG